MVWMVTGVMMHNISTILHYLDKLEDRYREALVSYYEDIPPEIKFEICRTVVRALLIQYPYLLIIAEIFLAIKAKELGLDKVVYNEQN